MEARVTVVVATRNRRESLLHTLSRLAELPERCPVIVVDNGSTDGSAAAVRERFPAVGVVALPDNRGAPARNLGVEAARTPYVAFADDDSWWSPGSLDRAADLLDADARLAVVVGAVRLDPGGELDAVSRKLARALLGAPPGAAGPTALSFPAFAAVVRRTAFLEVGGFSDLLFFGGEEQLLIADLAAAGWQLEYIEDVAAFHRPGNPTLSPQRWAVQTRNDVLVLWLRRPLWRAAAATVRLACRAPANPAAGQALAGVIRRLPTALSQRKPVPRDLDRALRVAERPE